MVMGNNDFGNHFERGINIGAMGVWLAGERVIDDMLARQRQRSEIIAHNQRVAAIRRARARQRTAAAEAAAARRAVGQARMARWLDDVELTSH